MIARRRRLQVTLQLLGDIAATLLALLVAYWLRFGIEVVPVTKGTPPAAPYLRLIPAIVVLWPLVFYFQRLYQMRRGRSRFEEAVAVVVAVGLASVILIAGLNFYRDFSYSRLTLAIFALADVVLVILFRWGIAAFLNRIRRSGANLQRILVVGASELGRQVVDRIRTHREYGFRVVGFLDDDPGKQQRSILGVPVLGTTAELERVVAESDVDQVLLALPLAAHNRTVQLIRRAGPLLVEVKVVPDLLQYYALKAGIEDLDGMPIINLTEIPLQGWNELVKRTFDVTVSLAAMIALAPALPVVAWLIRREDGGPVFYTQTRMGLDGRSFELYKFRTMRSDAESDGAEWTRTRDSRVTAIGAFLRRTSLDELPQLLNVFKGEMSLVGPRPERPEFVDRFKSRYPEYMDRHRVRSGLTGWAQVNGLRGDTSIRQRIVHDLFYVENWSLALDLKILWMTLASGWRNPRE